MFYVNILVLLIFFVKPFETLQCIDVVFKSFRFLKTVFAHYFLGYFKRFNPFKNHVIQCYSQMISSSIYLKICRSSVHHNIKYCFQGLMCLRGQNILEGIEYNMTQKKKIV